MKLIIRQYTTNIRLTVNDGGRPTILLNNAPEIIRLVVRQGNFTINGGGGGTGSVTSAQFVSLEGRVSGNSAQTASADTALYQAVSVLSQQVSVLSARVASNSVQMVSADNAISNAVSIVSAAQAATSAEVTSVKNSISVLSQSVSALVQAVSVVSAAVDTKNTIITIQNQGSNAVSNPATLNFYGNAVSTLLSAGVTKINISTTGGGGGSVTSVEYLSLVDRVSGNSAQMASADNALYQAVSVLSQQVSVLSARVESNSAQMTSADNAISNAVSIVSAAQAVTSAAQAATSAAVTSVNNRVSAISTNVTSITNLISVLNQQVSVLSARVAGNSAQMTSADNAISNAVSIVSAAQAVTSAAQAATSAAVTSVNQIVSALSQQVSVLSARVASNSAQMTSADGTKNRIISIANQGSTLTTNPERIDFTGNAVSSFLSGSTVKVNISVTAGNASVTSAEYLSLVDRVSGNSAQMTSADNAISNAVSIVSAAQAVTSAAQAATSAAVTSVNQIISVISQQVSVLSARVNSNSAQMTSADNAISNAVSIVSAAQAVTSAAQAATSAAVTSVNQIISVISQQVSVLSARVNANSAQMTSADNAISNAVSIVSAAVVSTNNRISAVSADLTSFKQSINNFTDVSIASPTDGQALVYNSAAAQWVNSTVTGTGGGSVTSAEYASTVSIVSTLQWPAIDTVTSALYSVVEADRGKIKYFTNAASIEVVLPDGLTSGFQAVIYRASAAGVLRFSATSNYEAQGSVLNDAKTAATIIHRGSNNWLALGAFLPAEIDDVQQRVSVLSQAVSVLSQAVSVLSAAVAANIPQTKYVVNNQASVSATAFTKISGLSLSLAASAIYQVEAAIIWNQAVASVGAAFNISTSAATFTDFVGQWQGVSVAAGATNNIINQPFATIGSAVFSVASVASTTKQTLFLDCMIVTSTTAGQIRLQTRTLSTTAAIVISRGSYIKAFRIG